MQCSNSFGSSAKGNNNQKITTSDSHTEKYKKMLEEAKLLTVTNRCWQWRKDYWSYEVCVGNSIRQFRAGETAEFLLGMLCGEIFTAVFRCV